MLWAGQLSSPFSEFATVAAILVMGIALSNLWFSNTNTGIAEIIMGNAQILYWMGIFVGAIAFFGFCWKTLADLLTARGRKT